MKIADSETPLEKRSGAQEKARGHRIEVMLSALAWSYVRTAGVVLGWPSVLTELSLPVKYGPRHAGYFVVPAAHMSLRRSHTGSIHYTPDTTYPYTLASAHFAMEHY